MISTGGELRVSRSESARPLTIRIPSVEKYEADDFEEPALTVGAIDRRSIGDLHGHAETRALHRRRAAYAVSRTPGTASTAARTSPRYLFN